MTTEMSYWTQVLARWLHGFHGASY